MRLSDFIKDSSSALESLYPGPKEAGNIVQILCSHVLGTKSYTYIVEPEYEISPSSQAALSAAMKRLLDGEPIQYVTGKATFCDLEFRVSPAVLIPRPETEALVREAVKIAGRIRRLRIPYGKNAEPVRVLDLCTGSGCIAWAVALMVPGVKVTGVDISSEALEVARNQDFKAALKNSGAVAPVFTRADILDEVSLTGEFDLILSNPPYIMEKEKPQMHRNVLDFEPETALFVPDGDPLLFYRAIERWSRTLLAPGGMGLTEINEALGPETKAVFASSGFSEVSLVKDFYDKNRFVFYKK